MLAFACLCQAAYAKPGKSSDNKSEDGPSLALLEYLAELQQVDGQWVSPMDMLDEQDSKLQTLRDKEASNDEAQKKARPDTKRDDKARVKDSTEKEVKQ